jgi:hypothetical protein
MWKTRGIVAALVGMCALLAAILVRLSLPFEPPTAADLESSLASIRRELAEEQRARESLAREVAELRRRLEDAAEPAVAGESHRTAASRIGNAEQTETSKALADEPSSAERSPAASPESSPVFDVEGLVAAGLAPGDAQALRERWERYELDKLELNDRAMRESFFMTPRHRNEHLALDLAFRSDIGDEGYDAYLFATGKPNRVVVREVIPDSAAAGAGLQRGDEILRYNEAIVFSPGELHLQTASGARGDLVPVQVLREGRLTTLRVEQGPLGVVLDAARRSPGRP